MLLFRKALGKKGEQLGSRHLKGLGYRILQQNYKKKCGEIDIIALDGDELVFIEVKTRSNVRYGGPEAAVTLQKQKQIIKTAQTYLLEKDLFDHAVRFDVLAILINHPQEGDMQFELFKNAFGEPY